MRDNIYIPNEYEPLWRDLKRSKLVPGLIRELLKREAKKRSKPPKNG